MGDDLRPLLVVCELLDGSLTGCDLAVTFDGHLTRCFTMGRVEQLPSKFVPGLLEVVPLAASPLHDNDRVGRPVHKPDRRISLVPMLTTLAVSPVREDLYVRVEHLDFHVTHSCKDGKGRR